MLTARRRMSRIQGQGILPLGYTIWNSEIGLSELPEFLGAHGRSVRGATSRSGPQIYRGFIAE